MELFYMGEEIFYIGEGNVNIKMYFFYCSKYYYISFGIVCFFNVLVKLFFGINKICWLF